MTKLVDRKLGYQRLSNLLFWIDHLEISNGYDAETEAILEYIQGILEK